MNNKKLFVFTTDSALATQKSNAQALNAVSTILSTCLGPHASHKMILGRMGTIETTNDGHAVLSELDISHPVLRILTESVRSQSESGDGTTSVVVLTSELMSKIVSIDVHPIKIVNFLHEKLSLLLEFMQKKSILLKNEEIEKRVRDSLNTKMVMLQDFDLAEIALKCARRAQVKRNFKYVKLMGDPRMSICFEGEVLQKKIEHPFMPKIVINACVAILEHGFEYKKGESQINIELSTGAQMAEVLKIENEYVKGSCDKIRDLGVKLLFVEKGVCDYALGLLFSYGITVLRRLKKTETTRIATATNAKRMYEPSLLAKEHIGTCSKFYEAQIANDFYCFIEGNKERSTENPDLIATALIFAPNQTLAQEFNRNFMDAFGTAQSLINDPRVVPGGGSIEFSMSNYLERLETSDPIDKKVTVALASTFKLIPALLAKNCGADPLDVLYELAQSSEKNMKNVGYIADTNTVGDVTPYILEPLGIKSQIVKAVIETVSMLLRVDGIIQTDGNKDSRP